MNDFGPIGQMQGAIAIDPSARLDLAPLAGRGRTAMTMRSIGVAIRVRGRFHKGGVGDKSIVDALNHRCRIAFSDAPSPGARAYHARAPTSPRSGGEVRKRPRHASIAPD